jgi:hypothetical protein
LQTHRTCSTFETWPACGNPLGIADADCGASPIVPSASKPMKANFGFTCSSSNAGLEAEKRESAREVAAYRKI